MSDVVVRRNTIAPVGPSPIEREQSRRETLREFLAFQMANETYALPLASVREILKPPPITEVPRAPSEVLGIISVRGRITTVIDLRRRLRIAEAAEDKHTRVLLIEGGEEVLGLLVDRVMHVYRLSEEEVELAAVVGGEMSEYVMGIGRPKGARGREREGAFSAGRDEDLLILLDPATLLRR